VSAVARKPEAIATAMTRWIPDAPVLYGGPPRLMFADDDPLWKQRKILSLQCDIPETRKDIRDGKRRVARAGRNEFAKQAAIAELERHRAHLKDIGDELRRLSIGRRHRGMRPGSFYLWPEYNEKHGEDPDAIVQCLGGAHA